MEKNFLEDDEGPYRNFLKVLFNFATTENNRRLPTNEKLIYNEIVRGTVDYITGKQCLYVCPPKYYAPHYLYKVESLNNYEILRLWNYFQQELKTNEGKLNPVVKETLCELLEPRCLSDDWGGVGYDPWLYTCFDSEDFDYPFGNEHKTFLLSKLVLQEVKEQILPSLSDQVLKDLGGIGKAMSRYLESDLSLYYRPF